MTAPALISQQQAAECLGVDVRTVRRLTQAGKLAYVGIGSRVMFTDRALTEFIAANEVRKIPSRSRSVRG
jgi:excisionase family DNA binding protein